tara:strand:- start:277 stop:957 length:681 start_codon:yes stop_codon:yes gene_type:complete
MHNYSIIIPVHNEVNQVPSLLNSLKEISDKGNEIIIIDDGSNDGSTDILSRSKFISLIILDKNKGKGYAIRKGLEASTNNKIVIYDGDMELDPLEIDKLMILNKSQNINFVMGNRFNTLNPLKSNFDWGNFMFTSFFNILFNSHSKDILCCAKAFYLDDIKITDLESMGFDIDIELSFFLTIKSKRRRIPQVRINYKRRDVSGGKKLKISDGWIILLRTIKKVKYL